MRESGNLQVIRHNASEGALAWLRLQSGIEIDDTLERLFAAKVLLAADDAMGPAVDDVLPTLTEEFARRLSMADVEAVTLFLSSDAGQRFIALQLTHDRRVRDLVAARVWQRVFPAFPAILQSSLDSRATLQSLRD